MRAYYVGSLAPIAKLRAMVGPQEPVPDAHAAQAAECDASCEHHRPARLSWAKLHKRLRDLELEHGPNCAVDLKIIAAIHERPAIGKILTQLRLQALALPRAPAFGSYFQAS